MVIFIRRGTSIGFVRLNSLMSFAADLGVVDLAQARGAGAPHALHRDLLRGAAALALAAALATLGLGFGARRLLGGGFRLLLGRQRGLGALLRLLVFCLLARPFATIPLPG